MQNGKTVKTIGRYQICGMLGKGGMAKVYKVKLPVVGQLGALKLLAPNPLLIDLMGADRVEALFIKEAVTMAHLRHPNLLALRDFDTHRGTPFLVMEYYCHNLGALIGETYRTESPSRTLPVDKAIAYTRQLLQGLDFLHLAGLVHRDIKPFNLLISDQDTLKIADFGLSQRRGEVFQGPANLKVGSPYYAAPEQEQDPDNAGFSADVFAAGVVFQRLLTGVLPANGKPVPSRCRSELTGVFDAVVAKATDPVAGRRFADAGAMLEALEALAGEWEKHKQKICLLEQDGTSGPATRTAPCPSGTGRRWGRRRTAWGLDELGRPTRIVGSTSTSPSPDTVQILETGLVWQKSGSAYPLCWSEAQAHIEHLNRTGFAGCRRWRLPSVAEIITLVGPPDIDRHLCLAPVFDPRQKWLWSGERRSPMTVWFVNVALGYVGWQDMDCRCYVRAVSESTASGQGMKNSNCLFHLSSFILHP